LAMKKSVSMSTTSSAVLVMVASPLPGL